MNCGSQRLRVNAGWTLVGLLAERDILDLSPHLPLKPCVATSLRISAPTNGCVARFGTLGVPFRTVVELVLIVPGPRSLADGFVLDPRRADPGIQSVDC
jgi:hypothetical protein